MLGLCKIAFTETYYINLLVFKTADSDERLITVSFLTVSLETFITFEKHTNTQVKKMEEECYQAIKDYSPFIAWIHNISLNQQKYMKTKFRELDLGHDVRYIMFIYDNPGCSQEDLVNMFGQSKGNIAKALRKLEDKGFIQRDVNPQNRRKYMLNTTEKGNNLVPEFRRVSKQWEQEVGITEADIELKRRIRQIAINGMKLIEDN